METLIKEHNVVKLTVPTPEESAGSISVGEKSIVEWSNNSKTFPLFEIEWIGPSPLTPDANLKGSIHHPIVAQVTGPVGEYKYKIHHMRQVEAPVHTTGGLPSPPPPPHLQGRHLPDPLGCPYTPVRFARRMGRPRFRPLRPGTKHAIWLMGEY